MFKRLATTAAVVGLAVSGLSSASANQGTTTYNGMNDSYAMTGILDVSATTVGGSYIKIPVFTMDACAEEDGSGTDACVWHGPTRGNGDGGSIVYVGLGDEKDYAYINHEAARILLKPSETVQAAPVESAPVESAPVQAAPTVEHVQVAQHAAPVEEEPVDAVQEPCTTPYGPDVLKCGDSLVDAFTGEPVEAPAMLRTVNGQPYQDVTTRKVRLCEPRVWETHCATREAGTGTPVFITLDGDDHIRLPGFELREFTGDTGLFVQR